MALFPIAVTVSWTYCLLALPPPLSPFLTPSLASWHCCLHELLASMSLLNSAFRTTNPRLLLKEGPFVEDPLIMYCRSLTLALVWSAFLTSQMKDRKGKQFQVFSFNKTIPWGRRSFLGRNPHEKFLSIVQSHLPRGSSPENTTAALGFLTRGKGGTTSLWPSHCRAW